MTRNAWLYLRISRDEANDRLGVTRQEEALRAMVAERGWTVAGVHVDNDLSAYRARKRAGYEALLASVNSGDVIVVTELSRLTRHPRELEDLVEFVEKRRVDITALRAGEIDLSTSGGRAIARVLGTMARMESEQLSERVAAKLNQNAAAGHAHGGVPHYGYRRVSAGVLEIDEDEAAIVKELVGRAMAGESFSSMVADLNKRGVPARLGGIWRVPSIGKILRSPTIAGLRVSKGEVVGEATWPPIIDRATHERVVAKLAGTPVGPRPRRNLLLGFARCDECQAVMTSGSGGRSRKNKRSYSCSKENGGCGSNSVSADRAEQYVTALVIGAAATVDLSRARQSVDFSSVAQSLADDERLLAELASDLGERRITRAEWLAARGPLTDRITQARAQLEAANEPVVDRSLTEHLDIEKWKGLTFAQKRAVVGLFVDRVTVKKGKRGRNFDFTRLDVEWRI
jgi:DNA invertase Pin-like site-specific DNA recombinase